MSLLPLRVEKRFRVPAWDMTQKSRAMDFWSRRRARFNETSENLLIGHRGNILGNLTSFDMTKLMAKLTITVSNQDVRGADVNCVLVVNTFGQSITEWNRAWWDLEMETFESFLVQGDEQEERWKDFRERYKKKAVVWTATLGAGGRTLDPNDNP